MVTQQLRKQATFEKAGGLSLIIRLANRAASTLHIEDRARVLLEYAMRRSVIHLAKAMDEEAHNESIDIFNLLDTSERSFYDISEQHVCKQAKPINTLLPTPCTRHKCLGSVRLCGLRCTTSCWLSAG